MSTYTQGPTKRRETHYRTQVTGPDGTRYLVSIWQADYTDGRYVGTIRVDGDAIYQRDGLDGAYAHSPAIHLPGSYAEHSAAYDAAISLAPLALAVHEAVRGAVQS